MADSDRKAVAEAATRALRDPSYAQQVLEGQHGVPEVRHAILAELAQTRDAILKSLPDRERELAEHHFRGGDAKAERTASPDAMLGALPPDQRAFMTEFIRTPDPGSNPRILETFIKLRSPAGSHLVNLGAHLNAAPW
jgi:hypothetical protein